ncbi:MAG: copper chaperone PCu(A)C [Gammaproteobacteria bacterium]|nr:copper chaperone PCu(A)C [Gammaproteobacteria bacterium]
MRYAALLLALLGLLTLGTTRASELEVREAWIREAPPVADVLAGYLVIDNPGPTERSLTGASSPLFRRVTLHRTVVSEGRARMVRQEAVPIPPGGSVRFEPGGHHLMLMGPRQRLAAGDRVPLTLQLGDGARLSVEARVRRGANEPGHGGHGHR